MAAAELSMSTLRAAADRAFPVARGTVVYADRAVRDAGTLQVGAASVAVTAPSVLVFRDELPGANWMHPCSYAVVDVASGDVVYRAPADRPPVFGLLPSTWVVVSDPDEMADLLPPSQLDTGERHGEQRTDSRAAGDP